MTEDAIEARAFTDLHRISPRNFRDEVQFDCLSIGGGCAISLPDAPAIGLNRILGLASVEHLDTAFEWIRRKAGNRFLQVNVDAAPSEVSHWIETRNLQAHGPGWAKLVCDTPLSNSPAGIRTRKVAIREAVLFGEMMCEGFNFPSTLAPLWSAIVGQEGWSCFFALDGEMPIGTGAMFVSGRHAWLGGGNTLPAYRNRGVQKALIQARTETGLEQGVTMFVVETEVPCAGKPNVSYQNLRKMGFEHAYDRHNFKVVGDEL